MIRCVHTALMLLMLPMSASAQDVTIAPDTSDTRTYFRFMYMPEGGESDARTDGYRLEAGPDLWYNAYDGLKFGVRLLGAKADTLHAFEVFLWANSGIGQYGLPKGSDRYGFMPMSFQGSYRTSLHGYWRHSSARITARALDGLYGGTVELNKDNRRRNITYSFSFRCMYRPVANGLPYLLDRAHWDMGRWNNSFGAGLSFRYGHGLGTGSVEVALRTNHLGSDHDYHYLRTTAINHTDLWMLHLRSRVFAQMGYGTDWASESLLYLDRASPEEMMDSRFTRVAGIFPAEWGGYGIIPNHFHHGGGLNLRGYSGYLAPEVMGNRVVTAHSGANGFAINLELEFDRLLGSDRWPLREWVVLTTYLFGDAGIISTNRPDTTPSFAMSRADAGVGLALTVKRWGTIRRLDPLTVRLDMPVFVSRPAAMQPDPWGFRWMLGIGRTF